MPEYDRWYMKPETKAKWYQMKEEYEDEMGIPHNPGLSQDEFPMLFFEKWQRIKDVLIEHDSQPDEDVAVGKEPTGVLA